MPAFVAPGVASDHPGYVPGLWYSLAEGAFGTTNAAGAVDTLYVAACFIRAPVTVSRLAVRVVTGVAATSCKVALWRNSNGRPAGTPLLGSDTGLSTVTSSSTPTTAAFSPTVSLPAGVYWVGGVFAGGLPTLVHHTSSAFHVARQGTATVANALTSQHSALSTPFTASGNILALNLDGATWTGVGTAGGAPLVAFEVAA